MTKEKLDWREQLRRASVELNLTHKITNGRTVDDNIIGEAINLEEEKQCRRIESFRSRGRYEEHFEQVLYLLVDSQDEIISWRSADSTEQLEGIHYFIETKSGPIPFAIHSTHRRAQEKRKKHEDLRSTTLSLRAQHKKFIKPTQKLAKQVIGCIEDYRK